MYCKYFLSAILFSLVAIACFVASIPTPDWSDGKIHNLDLIAVRVSGSLQFGLIETCATVGLDGIDEKFCEPLQGFCDHELGEANIVNIIFEKLTFSCAKYQHASTAIYVSLSFCILGFLVCLFMSCCSCCDVTAKISGVVCGLLFLVSLICGVIGLFMWKKVSDSLPIETSFGRSFKLAVGAIICIIISEISCLMIFKKKNSSKNIIIKLDTTASSNNTTIIKTNHTNVVSTNQDPRTNNNQMVTSIVNPAFNSGINSTDQWQPTTAPGFTPLQVFPPNYAAAPSFTPGQQNMNTYMPSQPNQTMMSPQEYQNYYQQQQQQQHHHHQQQQPTTMGNPPFQPSYQQQSQQPKLAYSSQPHSETNAKGTSQSNHQSQLEQTSPNFHATQQTSNLPQSQISINSGSANVYELDGSDTEA